MTEHQRAILGVAVLAGEAVISAQEIATLVGCSDATVYNAFQSGPFQNAMRSLGKGVSASGIGAFAAKLLTAATANPNSHAARLFARISGLDEPRVTVTHRLTVGQAQRTAGGLPSRWIEAEEAEVEVSEVPDSPESPAADIQQVVSKPPPNQSESE